LKTRGDVPSLRASRRFAIVRDCFRGARGLHGMRLIEFSVLGDHLHLIIESDNSVCLSRGMQGLCVRLVKALNRFLRRTGGLFNDHYFSRLLRTPTEVANALDYVKRNAERHYGETGIDACSSSARDAKELLEEPKSWLLRVGWRLGRRDPNWLPSGLRASPNSSGCSNLRSTSFARARASIKTQDFALVRR
jgi:putative transposase